MLDPSPYLLRTQTDEMASFSQHMLKRIHKSPEKEEWQGNCVSFILIDCLLMGGHVYSTLEHRRSHMKDIHKIRRVISHCLAIHFSNFYNRHLQSLPSIPAVKKSTNKSSNPPFYIRLSIQPEKINAPTINGSSV